MRRSSGTLAYHSPNTNNMVRLRMSRSLGVLVSLFLGNAAQPCRDGDVLLVAGLKCHGRGVYAAAEIDPPKLIEGDVER